MGVEQSQLRGAAAAIRQARAAKPFVHAARERRLRARHRRRGAVAGVAGGERRRQLLQQRGPEGALIGEYLGIFSTGTLRRMCEGMEWAPRFGFENLREENTNLRVWKKSYCESSSSPDTSQETMPLPKLQV